MKSEREERIIMGIDPGTTVTGYGIIRGEGPAISLVTYGLIRSSRHDNHFDKISRIFTETLSLIDTYGITELSVESPFQGKNVQSMLKLGRAQGAAISAALHRSLPVSEYAPRKIKISVTGQGSASKEQVAGMVMNMLGLSEEGVSLDATDGLAAAVCHFYQGRVGPCSGKPQTWKDFIDKNPDRTSG